MSSLDDHIVKLLKSKDSKERLAGEYLEIRERCWRLGAMLERYPYEVKELPCSFDILQEQLRYMKNYLDVLKKRVKAEDVNVEYKHNENHPLPKFKVLDKAYCRTDGTIKKIIDILSDGRYFLNDDTVADGEDLLIAARGTFRPGETVCIRPDLDTNYLYGGCGISLDGNHPEMIHDDIRGRAAEVGSLDLPSNRLYVTIGANEYVISPEMVKPVAEGQAYYRVPPDNFVFLNNKESQWTDHTQKEVIL